MGEIDWTSNKLETGCTLTMEMIEQACKDLENQPIISFGEFMKIIESVKGGKSERN